MTAEAALRLEAVAGRAPPRLASLIAIAVAGALAALAIPGAERGEHALRPAPPTPSAMARAEALRALWNLSHPPLETDGPLSQNGVVPAPGARGVTPAEALAINARQPFAADPGPAAAAFRLTAAPEDRQKALTCLTQAVYYEAGFEPLEGAEAVAQVVLNRLRHPAFPKSVCGVVYDGSARPTGCQFTFTCDGSLARRPAAAAWKRAEAVAARALDGFVFRPVGEATHYHTQWVAPYWSPFLVKITQIGAHIFYRWPGAAGGPRAFSGRYAGLETVAYQPAETPGAAPPTAAPAADAPTPVIKPELAALNPGRIAREATAMASGAPAFDEERDTGAAPAASAPTPPSDHTPISAAW